MIKAGNPSPFSGNPPTSVPLGPRRPSPLPGRREPREHVPVGRARDPAAALQASGPQHLRPAVQRGRRSRRPPPKCTRGGQRLQHQGQSRWQRGRGEQTVGKAGSGYPPRWGPAAAAQPQMLTAPQPAPATAGHPGVGFCLLQSTLPAALLYWAAWNTAPRLPQHPPT